MYNNAFSQMMDDVHHHHKHPYKSAKHIKKRRPISMQNNEDGSALTPGQRRSARPIKPSKAFENYSVYPDDESSTCCILCVYAQHHPNAVDVSSSEPSSSPSMRIPAHKPSHGESDVVDTLLMMSVPMSRGPPPHVGHHHIISSRGGPAGHRGTPFGGAYHREDSDDDMLGEHHHRHAPSMASDEEDDGGDTTSAMPNAPIRPRHVPIPALAPARAPVEEDLQTPASGMGTFRLPELVCGVVCFAFQHIC